MKIKDAKEIRLLMETRLGDTYATLGLGEPPKKIRKVLARAAKKISNEIKAYLKDDAWKKQKETAKQPDKKQSGKKTAAKKSNV